MQHFTKLKVWERSHALTLDIYRVTQTFPKEERYGLVSQIRRSASSVPMNISEGAKRKSPVEFARFINIAEGSISETEYQLMLSRDLGYLTKDLAQKLITEASEIARMLYALRKKLETSDAKMV